MIPPTRAPVFELPFVIEAVILCGTKEIIVYYQC